MKVRIIFSFSFILVLLLAMETHAGDHPIVFQTRAGALEYGCKILPLKKRNVENGIVWGFDGHHLIMSIYDLENDGKFVRRNQLKIVSWYNFAKISYEDLLGNGIAFIKIESEGNTGTGTLQMIRSYWGWKGDGFVPVFFETKSYHRSYHYSEDLKVDYKIHKKASKQVSLILTYRYLNTFPEHKSKYSWTESFTWNDSLFSFYTPELQRKKLIVAKNPIQKRIIETRLNFVNQSGNMETIDDDLLNKIRMMHILNDD